MALMVLIEFIVDQNDAFVGDVHRDVAAVAFDLVQIVLHFIERKFRRRRILRKGKLRVSDPAQRQEKRRGAGSSDKGSRKECSAHCRTLYQNQRGFRVLSNSSKIRLYSSAQLDG